MDPALWTRGRNAIAFVALISWIAAIAGYFLDPTRFFQSYLVGFLFSIFIPLGALFFLMVMFLPARRGALRCAALLRIWS